MNEPNEFEPNDMHPDELRRHGHVVADWVADFLAGIEDLPVLPRVSPGDVLAMLPERAPETGESMEAILADVDRIIVPATTQWNHPGFHAYFANTGSGPGILAETMIAAINNNAMLWRTGPAATELEARVCDWIRQMIGLPAGFEGHIEDTASISTIATLGAVRDEGLHALAPLRVYCSEEAHSSVERAAIVLGLGTRACRRIEVDADFRMRPDRLAAAIDDDVAHGFTPMAVVATTGTTSTTSVDPVPAIADICERTGVWLHVDAAYGGSMAVSERFRWVLEGCERAHSLVINPHKWLFVPMDCSVLLTRDAAALREALSLVPPYLMTPEDGVARNLMDYGPALGRRFRSLKVWFVLRWFGRQRLAALIEAHVALAADFAGWIRSEPQWELLAPVPMSTVLFRHVPREGMGEEELKAHNQRILTQINDDGRSFLSHTEVRHGAARRYALRFAVGNARTHARHVQGAWDRLRAAAGALGPSA